jgi:hypothetical protein
MAVVRQLPPLRKGYNSGLEVTCSEFEGLAVELHGQVAIAVRVVAVQTAVHIVVAVLTGNTIAAVGTVAALVAVHTVVVVMAAPGEDIHIVAEDVVAEDIATEDIAAVDIAVLIALDIGMAVEAAHIVVVAEIRVGIVVAAGEIVAGLALGEQRRRKR